MYWRTTTHILSLCEWSSKATIFSITLWLWRRILLIKMAVSHRNCLRYHGIAVNNKMDPINTLLLVSWKLLILCIITYITIADSGVDIAFGDLLLLSLWLKPGFANGPTSRGVQGGGWTWGGLAGHRINLHRKKFHFLSFTSFWIRKAKKKIWKKPWFSQFCKFCRPSPGGGVGGTTSTPYWL